MTYKRKGPRLTPEAEAWMTQRSLENFVSFYKVELLYIHAHGRIRPGVNHRFGQRARSYGLASRTRSQGGKLRLTEEGKEMLGL